MTKLLSEMDFKIADNWARSSKPPTYHLEVKSTTEKCEEPFYMSNNQVDKVRPSSRITKCAMYANDHRLVLINCKDPMQHRLMSM